TSSGGGNPGGSGSNTATVATINNPDTYSCAQVGSIGFEAFDDTVNLSTGPSLVCTSPPPVALPGWWVISQQICTTASIRLAATADTARTGRGLDPTRVPGELTSRMAA